MFYKTLLLATALLSPLSEIKADNHITHNQSAENLKPKEKSEHCNQDCQGRRGPDGKRGKRGKRGHHGKRGIPGLNGTNLASVFADALFEQPAGGTTTTFQSGVPIIFTEVTRSKGVDTSVPGSFTIQTPGDYYITYYVNGAGTSGFGQSYIYLLRSGTSIPESVIGFQSGSNLKSNLGGETILHLNAGDVIQLAVAADSDFITSTPSSSTQPVKVASLTVVKLNL